LWRFRLVGRPVNNLDIWLTWRQFRAQTLVAGAALILFAVVFLTTGPGLARLYDTSGLGACHAPANCAAATNTFLSEMKADAVYPLLYLLATASLILAPAAIGAFWGAPLVARELEAGTFRLAWHQSVTAARWTAVKLAGPGQQDKHVNPHLVAAWNGAGELASLEPPVRRDGTYDVRRLTQLLRAARNASPLTVWHCSIRNAREDSALN
jgi:hypothetical protein